MTLRESPARAAWVLTVLGVVGSGAGCAALEVDGADEWNDGAGIIGGVEAARHPEACVVNLGGSMCSGALVAPNVVLTAGHCVYGQSSWRVHCPYASDTSTVYAYQGEAAPNYPNRDDPQRGYIDNSRGSDVGLIRLERPLRETRLGRVRLGSVRAGASVYAIGRVENGRLSYSGLYQSPTFQLTAHDVRNGYWVGVDRTVIESGDSGGPLEDSVTGEIVAVNSAGVERWACTRGRVCDEWSVVGAAGSWYTATLQRYTGGTSTGTPPPPPPPPPDTCASSTDCGACTARSSCGWCNGRCVTGSSAGGGSCTSAARTWAWTSNQCPSVAPPPADPCATSADCRACTARSSCGWCNGRCRTGTSAGPNDAACGTSAWAWLSSACR